MKNCIYSILMLLGIAFTSNGQSNLFINSDWQEYDRIDTSLGVYLYPNPSQNLAHVILPEIAVRKVRLFILDFNGRLLQSQLYAPGGNQLDFDVTNLPRGIYSLKIQEEGMPLQSVKLVKNEN